MNKPTVMTLALSLGLLVTSCARTPVDNEKPTAILKANQTSFTSAGSVSLSVEAKDNVGVQKVIFKKDSVTINVDTVAPFEYADPVNKNGDFNYTAIAVDKAGNEGDSNTIKVTASGIIEDTTPPTINLTANQTVFTGPGTLNLTANATDDKGIEKVIFKKGDTIISEDSTSPYEASDPINSDGEFTYSATAVDTSGNTTTSTTLKVTASGTSTKFATFSDGNTSTTEQGGTIETYQYSEKGDASLTASTVTAGVLSFGYTVPAANSYGGVGANVSAADGVTYNLSEFKSLSLGLAVNSVASGAGKTTLRVFAQDKAPGVQSGCFPYFEVTSVGTALTSYSLPFNDSSKWQVPSYCTDPSKYRTFDQVKGQVSTFNVQADGVVGVTGGALQISNVILQK